MKIISTGIDYYFISSFVDKVINQEKKLPENVFNGSFRDFLFIDFTKVFMPSFFINLKRYLLDSGEDTFWLIAIDPNPENYFGFHFDFFGTIEFSTSDVEDDYLIALSDYPEKDSPDSIICNSNVLLFYSATTKWAIYADRNADIAICTFADKKFMERFSFIYGADLLYGLKAATDHVYGYELSSSVTLKSEFYHSYL